MSKLVALVLAVVCLCTTSASPQEKKTADQPNKYVWYEIAKVNSGKYQLYTKIVSQIRDAVNTTAPDTYWIAGSPITGDSDRITFVTFHDNMASIEKMMTAFDKAEQAANLKNASLSAQSAEAEGSSHSVLAEYSKELSYRPDMVPMANTTWWASSLFNLKPGCEYEFNDAVKQVADLHKRVADNEHWIAYEIRAGYPEPSILFVTPMRSLADQDQEPPAAAKELFESPLVRQMFQKVGKECIEHIESTYSRVEPSLSRPPQTLVATNPDFWTIKEETPAAATKKTKPKKGTPVQPAVLKEKEKEKTN
jgi:hypothetical protein